MGQLVFKKPRLVNEIIVSLMKFFSQALVWGCITAQEIKFFHISTFFGKCNIKSGGNC